MAAKKTKLQFADISVFDEADLIAIDFETGKKEYEDTTPAGDGDDEGDTGPIGTKEEYNITLFSLAADIGGKRYKGSYEPHLFDKFFQKNKLKQFIAHNAVYELLVLDNIGHATGSMLPFHDTMVMSHLLDEEAFKGLKDLRVTVLGKPARKDWASIDKTNKEEYMQYSADDAEDCLELYHVFRPRVTAECLESVYELELALQAVLVEIKREGVKVDVALAQKQLRLLAGFLTDIQTEIEAKIGYTINLKSSAQLKELFYEILMYPPKPDWKTATGYSTNKMVLNAISLDQSRPLAAEIASKILLHRKYTKLVTGFLNRLIETAPQNDGYIFPSFNSTGTVTGRFSCTRPNLQQIPGEEFIKGDKSTHIRSLFICEDDELLVTADYSQIELRLMAEFSNDRTLVNAYLEGMDIHQITADSVGCSRKQAKVINFGIGYGMGPKALSIQAKIPPRQADQFIMKFWEKYPGVTKLKDFCLRRARSYGYLRTWLGRKRRFREWNIHVENQTMNFLIQGSAADLMKLAMVKVHRMKDHNRAKCIMTVHDELTYKVKLDYVEEFMYILQYAMESAVDTKVPIIAEPSVGRRWSESK